MKNTSYLRLTIIDLNFVKHIRLSTKSSNCRKFPSTGTGSQSLSLINPKLNPIKNNNLVFDLSDSSLTGYNFKIYSDSNFNNEFISIGSTDNL